MTESAYAAVCDVDEDGDVDRADVKLIVVARDTPAGGQGDNRDADGDGRITMLDARACIRQCDLPNCKIIGAGVVAPADDASRADTVKTPVTRDQTKPVSKPTAAAPAPSGANLERGASGRNEWRVERGDTLYAIGRAFFPGNARQQARLRQDIVELNPTVFANGANNMDIGVVLKLPDYVVVKDAPPQAAETAPEPARIAVETTPAPVVTVPAVEPATVPAPAVTPAPATTATTEPAATAEQEEPMAIAQQDEPAAEMQAESDSAQANGGLFASLGYSFGGDEVVETDSGLDFTAGSGAHLRLGYEQLPNRKSGYRVAFGIQYNVTIDDGSDDASLSNSYLQLAYQYRADDLLFGTGVVMQAGTEVKNDVGSDIDYDTATGVAIYLENVGNGSWSGWGLSYTSIELDEEDSSETADASRIEAYYSWRF